VAPPLIAVFTKNRTNPGYAAARLAADRVAREAGARTVHYVPEIPDDVGQQKSLVAQAVMARPDAAVFTPVDDLRMVEELEAFAAARIPVFLFNNRMTGRFVSFVGSDDVAVGVNGATALFQALAGRGTVVAIEGTPAAPTSRDRTKGLQRALATYPDITLLATVTGLYQRPPARQKMADLLARHGQVDSVWAANDLMALGALDALAEAGRSAVVVGANGLPEAIGHIERGSMLASIDFSPFKIAAIATRAALRHLRGESVPPEIMVPAVVIDRSNCAGWKTPLEQRPLPTWEEIVG